MRAKTIASIPVEEFKKGLLISGLNERQRREYSGFVAYLLGYGGVSAAARTLGMSPITVRKGLEEFAELSGNEVAKIADSTSSDQDAISSEHPAGDRIRRAGGGRKSAVEKQPGLIEELEQLLEASTYGDPMRPLVWTTLSLRKIQEHLVANGFKVSHTVVGELLDELGYSKQVNQKMLQVNEPHPDRDSQFRFINDKTKEFLLAGLPVASIDCKKKENIGNFKNAGAEYRRSGDPRRVLDHDFAIADLGKVAPFGIYVLNSNTGFINLGTSADTGEFASESLGRWWHAVGKENFQTNKLYVICDGGGSNGTRVRLWKYSLAQLAERTGLEIHVSHLPPGTSKWNKVEHRLFCYISKNWQGQPLIDIETVVNLITSTTTKNGLKVDCMVDEHVYERGRRISDEEFQKIDIERLGEFGQWNYVIRGFV